jgi:phenylpropionate dioxygenase-like ring-hydroxylating dioxygenase large terminal subunit
MEAPRSASQEQVWNQWPRYRAAALGLRNYWYPVMASRDLRERKPKAITLCGEQIVLVRSEGRLYGLHDRCPHRGVKLSAGRCEFRGLLTCAYHGWCYDITNGELVAALTDGPDSPIVGKASVRVQTYPVEERFGVVFVYVGDLPAPPVEDDIPEELLRPDAVVIPWFDLRKGNWRYGAENAVDEGHAKYLHRRATFFWFTQAPAWTQGVRMVPSDDGKYLRRVRDKSVFQDTYPRIGTWPPLRRWKNPNRTRNLELVARLPCLFRVQFAAGWWDYEHFVPVDENHHLAVFFAAKYTRGLDALLFRIRYWTYIRWLYYRALNRGEDQWMIEQMSIPPERLYRPDASITAWRKWCEEHARGRQVGDQRPAAEEASEIVAGRAASARPGR